MSYRRKSEAAEKSRRYKSFVQANSNLVEQSGIPSIIVEDYSLFSYFVEHDCTSPHDCPEFSVDEMNAEQQKAYSRLLGKLKEAVD